MKTNDYINYDSLKLYVKKNKSKEIIEHYKLFGWEVLEEFENKKYEDILDLTFCRPHKIKNKDELQLLQVYMEERLNEQAKIEKHKHSKTTSIGLCLGVIGVGLITLGLLACLKVIMFVSLIGGILLAVSGLVFVAVSLIILPKIYKKEKIIYEEKNDQLSTELENIFDRVKTLAGDTYEKH